MLGTLTLVEGRRNWGHPLGTLGGGTGRPSISPTGMT